MPTMMFCQSFFLFYNRVQYIIEDIAYNINGARKKSEQHHYLGKNETCFFPSISHFS